MSWFKDRISHGLHSAGVISAVLGTRLPGPDSICAPQTLGSFRRRPGMASEPRLYRRCTPKAII
ncbi:hypothetical protein FFK22_035400 [Mycobacterium sp. KBS0706]|nr:hypothetical protein FFK22_035400 [Mycobacterium sp. KBS0706]